MPYKNKKDQADAARRHYLANRQKMIDRAAAARKIKRYEVKEYVNRVKNNPCVDCGVTYPYYVMQFDHTKDDKKGNVSQTAWRLTNLDLIKDEIAKCDLVCANCHAVRTWKRLNPPEDDNTL